MSLQVWLPLNGDLHNQGLAGDFEFTNTAASSITVDNYGKIGKCYNFNSSSNNNGIFSTDKDFMNNYINNHSWSLCAWIKTDASDTCVMSLSYGLRMFAGTNTYITLYKSGSTVTCYSSKNTVDGLWHHLVATYDTNSNLIKFYIDGEKTGEQSYTANSVYSSSWTNGLFIGKDPNNSTVSDHYLYRGKMNDVRIYDNALSDKEVKEIAKGLVLHYKLDTLETSLLYSTPKSVAPTSYCGYQLNLTENLVADQTYTLQLWDVDVYHSAKTAAQTGIWIYWGGGSVHLLNWAGPTYFTADGDTNYHADYLVKTFTVTSSQASGSGAANAWFNVYNSVGYVEGTLRMHIGNWKLEKGSIAHPMAFAPNQIFDCSGYNHHGEVLNNPSIINDTARFDNALHFSATNQKVKISNFPTSGFGNSYSFAWWEKISSVTPMHWGFADGIRLNGMYTGRLWNTGDSSNNPLYEPGTTTQVAAPTVNVWHHWVMTGDGISCKVYQDGVLWAQAKTYKAISGTTIFLNGWTQNTDYSSDNASISDFRIYATALSEEDISDLYHTSFSIDNKGNGYAREVIEDTSLNITKTGQFHGNEMLDDNGFTTASITKDDHQLKVNILYEH